MIKLNESGFITVMNDQVIYEEGTFDYENEEYISNPKINPYVFFNDSNSSKFDILMYEHNLLNRHIRLPITKDICRLFKENVKESVAFIFNDTYNDTPCTEDNIKKVVIPISNTRDAIDAYIQYITYKLINYLPYEDFAIDHMPTLETVLIDDKETDFFDMITSLINQLIEDVKSIEIYKNGKYKFLYDLEGKKSNHKKSKEPKIIYIRVNDALPVFYMFNKSDYKIIKKLTNIEISLSWYRSEDTNYLTEYVESARDEYLYSNEGIQSILTLDATFGYLYSYYMTESKEIAENHFLIITITGYFKLNDGKIGVRLEAHSRRFQINSILHYLTHVYPSYEFLKE